MSAASTAPSWRDHPTTAYIGPFVFFLILLAAKPLLEPLGRWHHPVRFVLVAASIWYFSRPLLTKLRLVNPLWSIVVGVATFFLWIGPDALIPGYRGSILFTNSVFGKPLASLPDALRGDVLVLVFRSAIATLLVPILEEFFWRGWLMRWLIKPEFEAVALGTFQWSAFLITAAFFASEHGSYWDVGLLTGLLWGAWMVKTRSLGDLMLTHAVTNGILCAYVIGWNQWQYWL